MGFIKRILRRKKRDAYHAPPPPSEEIREAVADVAVTAEIQLEKAESRETVVKQSSAHLHKIRTENALGPRFWQAAGTHRST